MKPANIFTAAPRVLVLTLPLVLASCANMPGFMNDSRDSENYYSQPPLATTSTSTAVHKSHTQHVASKAKVPTTKMVEPGVSTVVMPKSASTTPSAAPVDGPMVPGTAPSLGN